MISCIGVGEWRVVGVGQLGDQTPVKIVSFSKSLGSGVNEPDEILLTLGDSVDELDGIGVIEGCFLKLQLGM